MKRIFVLALLVALVGSTSPVFSAPDFAQIYHPPRIKVKEGTSTNWAGYAVETSLSNPLNNAVSDVTGVWVVPSVTCSAGNAYSSIWIGIDGYSDNTVEQIGTEQDCTNSQPSYSVWYEMYPKMSHSISMSIKAGDTISAEVKYTGNHQFTLTITNVSNGQSFSTVQRAKARRESAEWIVEAPFSGGVLPLANFGTAQITHATATLFGHTGAISDTNWADDAITMTTSSGAVKAYPSGLSSAGDSFSVTWSHQ